MPKARLFRFVMVVMMIWALTTFAQNSGVMNKLSEKPLEQILVFEVGVKNLAKIIETTAWKMNYDSVIVNSSQDKIMVFRRLPPSPLQYRILLTMAQLDSAVRLTSQGFWFVPPDSIPRYNKSMKAADRDLRKLFLYAVIQEIASSKGAPLHDRALPDKTFAKFMGWNLLNPGLASWYLMKDNPRTTQKSAIAWSACFGLLDVGYIALGLTNNDKMSSNQNEASAPFLDLTTRQLGIYGALTFRLAMTIGYFVDRDYRELKKSGYFFPKIGRFNFDTRYTKYISQSEKEKK